MTSIVFFSVLAEGHTRRLLPIVAAVAARGVTAYVCTERRFETEVRAAGGVLVDLLDRYPVDNADKESIPIAMRSVSYAGHFGEQIAREIAALGPSLVVYDTFAVIGRVVARELGLPSVNVCAGHNVEATRYRNILANDPRVHISAACLKGVETLRDRFRMPEAAPFSYVDSLSPHLNIYSEPPEFLTAEERRAFEPVAFFGSLLSNSLRPRTQSRQSWFTKEAARRKIYVSFGTIVWRYYASQAVEALQVISSALSGLPDTEAVISLGTADPDPSLLQSLSRPNVTVHGYVDQWSILAEADLFVTHHGLNSTHEAIWHGVPMISYPFFWDQPSLAARCRELGLAEPLTDVARGPITNAMLKRAINVVADRREIYTASLAAAREYEEAVMAGRDKVIGQILDLCERPLPLAGEPRYRQA